MSGVTVLAFLWTGVAMTDKRTQSMSEESNMEKDPSTWVTGDEAMTAPNALT